MCSGKRSYHCPLASAAATSFSTIGRRTFSYEARHFCKEESSSRALARAIASSIARRVPEPMEKWAVRRASPISTVFPEDHLSFLTFGKLRQIDRFETD